MNKSVWVRTQRTDDPSPEPKERLALRNLPGRLVAATATGPIYQTEAKVAVVPVTVALALIQELAANAMNPKANVVSSMARRVAGDSALATWAHTCGFLSSQLVAAAPRTRLMFLDTVLTYVGRQGNANGIEPILGAAVNAAWPSLESDAAAQIVTTATNYLNKSEFAHGTAIPIFDPNTRTVAAFAPGGLTKLDTAVWLNRRALLRAPLLNLNHGTNLGPGAMSGVGVPSGQAGSINLSGLGSAAGAGATDDLGLSGLSGVGVPSGQAGSINLSGLGSAAGAGATDDLGLSGLSGVGVPSGQAGSINLSGLGSAAGAGATDDLGLSGVGVPSGQAGSINLSGLGSAAGAGATDDLGLSGVGVPGGLGALAGLNGISGLGSAGGPFGFGASLGAEGAADGWDKAGKVGHDMMAFGAGLMTAGAAVAAAGATLTAATGGTGAPAGGPMIVTGLVMVGGGVVIAGVGLAVSVAADIKPGSDSNPSPGPAPDAGTGPAPDSGTAPGPAPDSGTGPAPDAGTGPAPDSGTAPAPEQPRDTDLYPDPDGGGNGHPDSIWDENGGGGNPTTIWDENGGGGNPTTAAKFVTATTTVGAGLLASYIQIGQGTFAMK
jgi:hypothetical protein